MVMTNEMGVENVVAGTEDPATGGEAGAGSKRPAPSTSPAGGTPTAKRAQRAPPGGSKAETVYRLLTPARFAGYVIGKSGSTIRSVRESTGSRVKVAEGLLGSEERVVIISSKANESYEECSAQRAVFVIYQKMIEAEGAAPAGVDNSTLPSPKTQLRMLVPQTQAGCVIGKGGVFIKEIRQETGANVRVLPPEQIPLCGLSNDRVLQMNGDTEQLQKALTVVTRKLWENPAREPPGGPPPCVWATLEQVQPQGQEMGGMASLAGMAGLGGMGGGVGMGMMGVGSSPMMGIGGGGGLMAMQPMQMSGMQMQSATASNTKRTVEVPNNQVGLVIGSGGSNIAQIREKSGAQVKVPPQTPGQTPDSMRSVEISGTPQQVSIAESMIRTSCQSRAGQ